MKDRTRGCGCTTACECFRWSVTGGEIRAGGMKTHGICLDSQRRRNSVLATSAGKANKAGKPSPSGMFVSHNHTFEAVLCVDTRGC